MVSISELRAQSWRESIIKKLPAPLEKIEIGKTTQGEVEKLIGKPALDEGDKKYWEFHQFKYSLELTFKNNVIQSLNFTFSKDRPDLKDFLRFLDLKKMKLYPEKGPSAGKFLKDSQLRGDLLIDIVSKKIYSVELR